ncbi:MAG: hypothetical protein QXS00_07975 [Pyrobaculum sp.]
MQKAGAVELVELAKALNVSSAHMLYVVRLLDGRLCYKVVGSCALVGKTCADVEERLRRDYRSLVEAVKRRCKRSSCCVKLRDVVSALIHRDLEEVVAEIRPRRGSYFALLRALGGLERCHVQRPEN